MKVLAAKISSLARALTLATLLVGMAACGDKPEPLEATAREPNAELPEIIEEPAVIDWMSRESPPLIGELRSALALGVSLTIRKNPQPDSAVLFESRDKADLDALATAIQFDFPEYEFHCLCAGSPAIFVELPQGDPLVLTNHHGHTFRCSIWKTDFHLKDEATWKAWFTARGIDLRELR